MEGASRLCSSERNAMQCNAMQHRDVYPSDDLTNLSLFWLLLQERRRDGNLEVPAQSQNNDNTTRQSLARWRTVASHTSNQPSKTC